MNAIMFFLIWVAIQEHYVRQQPLVHETIQLLGRDILALHLQFKGYLNNRKTIET